MEFLPCAQGNIGKKGNSYIFYYVYKIKFFGPISHCLNSSVSRATVLGLKGHKFESCLRQTLFSSFLIFSYLLGNASLICKKGHFISKCYKVYYFWNIEVLFSNILLKKYSAMRCGLDK